MLACDISKHVEVHFFPKCVQVTPKCGVNFNALCGWGQIPTMGYGWRLPHDTAEVCMLYISVYVPILVLVFLAARYLKLDLISFVQNTIYQPKLSYRTYLYLRLGYVTNIAIRYTSVLSVTRPLDVRCCPFVVRWCPFVVRLSSVRRPFALSGSVGPWYKGVRFLSVRTTAGKEFTNGRQRIAPILRFSIR